MARRRAIEADELFETANQLKAEGKDVTAVALLDALGGGSLRTIYKLLDVWLKERPAIESAAAQQEIPAVVQSAFNNSWRLATQEASRAVIAAKEKAAEEVDAAMKQFQGALDAIGKLEAESEIDAQQIESLKQRLIEVENALHKSQTDCASYLATSEQLRIQIKSQEQAVERLHGELDKERESRQNEMQRITQAAQMAQEKLEQQIEQLKSALSEEKKRMRDMEKETENALTQRDEAQRQLEKLEQISLSDRAERDNAIKEAAELRGLSEGLKTQNADLLSRLGRR